MSANLRQLVARWTRLAVSRDAPCARSSHALSAIGGKAFLFGGEATARTAIDSHVHCLDPSNGGQWTRIEPASSGLLPPPRIGHAQCATRDTLMIFGGRSDITMGEGEMNDLWAFQPTTREWSKIEASYGTPPSPRSFHRAASVGERLYVFGGCGAEGRLADLHEFDLATRRWTALPPPAELAGRGGASFEASSDGRGLLMAAGFVGHETNDVLRFDLAERTWQRVPSEWLRPRSVSASLSFAHPSGPVVALFGGEVAPSDRGHEGAGGFAADLIAIDPASGTPAHLTVDAGTADGGGDAIGSPPSAAAAPAARGWAAATAISPTEGVLFGGLAGSDAEPERLGDTWLLTLAEPMAYSRMV